MANGLWLRLYVEILHSRKVQSLPPDLFKCWVNMMCLAKSNAGLLPPTEDMAWVLRCDQGKLSDQIAALVHHRLIDETDNGLAMHDWDEHQFGSDSSTERVREFRKRKAVTSGNVRKKQRETLPERSEIVTVKHEVTAQSRTETEQRQSRTEQTRAKIELDEQWTTFFTEWTTAGFPQCSGTDWVEARTVWNPLDFEQKLAAIKGIRARAGVPEDSARKSLPKNYIQKRMWERGIVAPKHNGEAYQHPGGLAR